MSGSERPAADPGSEPVRAALRTAAEEVGLRAVLVTVPGADGEIVTCASTVEIAAVREGGLLPEGLEGLDDHSLPILEPGADHVAGELRWLRGAARAELDQSELQALSAFAEAVAAAQTGEAGALVSPARRPPSNTMRLLAALATRSVKSAWEVDRVIQLSEAVARELQLPEQAVGEVVQLAMLREIGNLGIPARVIEKRGLLTRSEYRQLREQPVLGERIVAAMPDLAHLAPLIRSSQERWDGSGYPDGLAGEQIPLPSRIVAVCNAYVAMLCDRPFRRPLAPGTAASIVGEKSGSQFCPLSVAGLQTVLESERTSTARGPAADRQAQGGHTGPLAPGLEPSEHRPAALVPPPGRERRAERAGGPRATLARDRTPDRATKVLYPLGLLTGVVLGVIAALPVDDPDVKCPPGTEARTQCVLQKVWLHELTVVFVVVLATMLVGYIAFFKLPDLIRRARAGELFADDPPPPVPDDPALFAATWGFSPDPGDRSRNHPHWRRPGESRGKPRTPGKA